MKEGAKMGIPDLFRCPISLDLFKDPVTLCTGQTYDRSSIEKWLAAGNLTCPVTMQKLHDPSMVPNHTLRHLIDQWLQMGCQFNPNYYQTIDRDPNLDPDPTGVALVLKHNLESHESPLGNKLQTLETIQVLSQELPLRNFCLIQMGFFPLLLEQVFGQVQGQQHSQDNLKFVEKALVCALNLLPYCNMGPLNMLKDESKLDYFLVLFDHGTTTIKTSLCKLVEAISSSLETKELCAILGNNHGFLQRIVLLLHNHNNSGAFEDGMKAMCSLCSLESNRESLVREGLVDGLITYIMRAERDERNLAPKAMAMLDLLLGLESAKQAVNDHPSGVNAMVKMVFRVSDHDGSESAINSLMIMCSDSVQARERAVCAGVLTQLLLLLQSQSSGRIKTRARMLLKLLRSMWDEDLTHV
ncbi:hypothetical protein CsSME_00002843 [Camellia sinensis var. sinensis]